MMRRAGLSTYFTHLKQAVLVGTFFGHLFVTSCLGLKLTPFVKGASFKPRQYLVKSFTCFLVKISLSIERFVDALLPNPVKR